LRDCEAVRPAIAGFTIVLGGVGLAASVVFVVLACLVVKFPLEVVGNQLVRVVALIVASDYAPIRPEGFVAEPKPVVYVVLPRVADLATDHHVVESKGHECRAHRKRRGGCSGRAEGIESPGRTPLETQAAPGETFMPVISMFYGVVVSMYLIDNRRHHLPHIHVRYQDDEAVFSIPDAQLLEGKLPHGKARLVEAWIEIHREELMADWQLAAEGQPVFRIDPLR